MNRQQHRVISVLLAFVLLLGLVMPAMAADHPFTDVREGAWYAEAVQFVYEHDIMGGVGGNRFDPQGNLTRAQVTALLFRTHHAREANAEDDRDNNFDDVGNAWYAPYITWAFDNGIVQGTSETTFNPHGNISRQEFATMVYRYAMNLTALFDWDRVSAQWSQFADRDQIATWAYSALRWMSWQGVVTGSSATTIDPAGTTTRAEAAIMMMRFVERLPPLTEELCSELVMQIREDWAAYRGVITAENAWISYYFGSYNGNVALMITDHRNSHDFADVVWNQEVAGVIFRYNSGQQILVWYDGEFFSLPQAYGQGLITAGDVESIHHHHRQAFPFMYLAK